MAWCVNGASCSAIGRAYRCNRRPCCFSSNRRAGITAHSPRPRRIGRAEALAGPRNGLGPYALQAAIAAVTRERRLPNTLTGRALPRCMTRLRNSHLAGRRANRAVAVSMAFGPAAGLELVNALASEPVLGSYYLLPSVRGDLLYRLGRADEARAEFERAATLTQNKRERDVLLKRAGECTRAPKTMH